MERRPIHTNVVKLSDKKRKNAKTPRAGTFKPGVSPNPGGRPRMPPDFVALMKEYSVTAAEELYFWMMQRDPKVSPGICQYVINRAYGMPTQATELSGPGGTAIQPPSLNVSFVSTPQVKQPEPEAIEEGAS